jgi:hypothetical protein
MAELASRLLFALSLASMAGAASAQSDTPWNGGYLGLNLGEASANACNSTAGCSSIPSAPATCAGFSGTTLDSNHSGFSANMFRIGINYWFSYWGP